MNGSISVQVLKLFFSQAPDVIFFFGVEARHLDLQCGEHSPENSMFFSVSCPRFWVRGVVLIVV